MKQQQSALDVLAKRFKKSEAKPVPLFVEKKAKFSQPFVNLFMKTATAIGCTEEEALTHLNELDENTK